MKSKTLYGGDRTVGRLGAALTLALALGATPAAHAQEPVTEASEAPLRIAVVDIDFLAVQSPSGQELMSEIRDLQQQFQTELETRQASARAIEQRIAEADSLRGEEKRQLERRYQDALTDFQRYQQDVRDRAQRMQAEGLARIREELGPVLEAIQQEKGYDLILNSQNAAVVLSSPRIDITQAVLDRLRAAAPGG